MRILPLAIAALLSLAPALLAQVTVEVVLDQDQFLRDEALPVQVRITNRSGQTLRLGRDNEWLQFAVEGLDHGAVPRSSAVPVVGDFDLESGQVAKRQVNIAPCYEISQPGRYQVTATIRIKEWNEELSSKPRPFEIVRGTKLWEQDFGVTTTSGPPEARKFMLQQATYRKHLRLYLRLTDLEDQKVFQVFPMGTLVSFSQPEAQLDKAGYLHVLFQTGPHHFLFHVVGPDGDLVMRQTYEYTASRPVLRVNSEGRIFVSGGMRRLAANDIPVVLPGDAIAPPVTNSTASTNRPADAHAKKDDSSSKK